MTKRQNNLTYKTKLLNHIESTGIDEIREQVGELKYLFSPIRNNTECRVSAYVNLGRVSPECQLFVMDAISKLKTFSIEKIGTGGKTTEVSFHRDMSDNYLNEDKQEMLMSSMERQVSIALENEYSNLKYLVKNDELISSKDLLGSVKSENTGKIQKFVESFRLKIFGEGFNA